MLALLLREDSVNVSADQVGKWIADGLLEWTNATSNMTSDAGYEFETVSKDAMTYDIPLLEYARDQIITPTQCDFGGECGVGTGVSHIAIGLLILSAFIVQDACNIFFFFDYQWREHSGRRSLEISDSDRYQCWMTFRNIFAGIVFLAQIATNMAVAISCGTKVVSSGDSINSIPAPGILVLSPSTQP